MPIPHGEESRSDSFHSETGFERPKFWSGGQRRTDKAFVVDIHEAVLGGHITKEEGEDLSPKYRPDEPSGNPAFKKTNVGRYNAEVKRRQQGKGSWDPNKRKKNKNAG